MRSSARLESRPSQSPTFEFRKELTPHCEGPHKKGVQTEAHGGGKVRVKIEWRVAFVRWKPVLSQALCSRQILTAALDSLSLAESGWAVHTSRLLPPVNPPDDRANSIIKAALEMAHHQLSQTREAREALSRAGELMRTQVPQLENGDLGREWSEMLIAQILRREAEALMGGNSGN